MSSLKEDLQLAMKEANTGLVILEGDKSSKLGNAVVIMDIAKAAGATKFAIAAEGESTPEKSRPSNPSKSSSPPSS